jgi:hypothetical protein
MNINGQVPIPKPSGSICGKNDFFMTLFRIKKCYSWPGACCTSIQIPGRPSPPSHSPVSTTVSRDLNPGLALSLQGKKHVLVRSSPWDYPLSPEPAFLATHYFYQEPLDTYSIMCLYLNFSQFLKLVADFVSLHTHTTQGTGSPDGYGFCWHVLIILGTKPVFRIRIRNPDSESGAGSRRAQRNYRT